MEALLNAGIAHVVRILTGRADSLTVRRAVLVGRDGMAGEDRDDEDPFRGVDRGGDVGDPHKSLEAAVGCRSVAWQTVLHRRGEQEKSRAGEWGGGEAVAEHKGG